MDTSVQLNIPDLFSAKGLVVVVTGGGSGIGRAITAALTQTGARRVYIFGRRLPLLQEAAKDLNSTSTSSTSSSNGPIVVPIECDVTNPTSISSAVSQIEQETGYIDVLINNAGVLGPDHKPANSASTIDELQRILLSSWETWQSTFAVNSSAVIGVSAAFLKLLDAGNRRRGWEGGKISKGRPRERAERRQDNAAGDDDDQRTSQIITVASIAGVNRYVTAGLAYSSSKAAAVHLGKMLAHLLAPWGIRSNIINPGIYPSEMTAGSKDEYSVTEIPAGRKGSFQDIAGVVLYLVGKGGAYANGNMQITDGGRLSVMPATY